MEYSRRKRQAGGRDYSPARTLVAVRRRTLSISRPPAEPNPRVRFGWACASVARRHSAWAPCIPRRNHREESKAFTPPSSRSPQLGNSAVRFLWVTRIPAGWSSKKKPLLRTGRREFYDIARIPRVARRVSPAPRSNGGICLVFA